MAFYNVTVSDAEAKALLWDLGSAGNAQVWLDNAIHNKARQCMDAMLLKETDRRLDLLSPAEKEAVINDLVLS